MKNQLIIKPWFVIALILFFQFQFQSGVAIDFVFNGFRPSSVSLYGNATIESRIITLTNDSTFSIGRALFPQKIPTKRAPNSSYVLPFSTSFIFAMAPTKGLSPGHGIVFLFVPHTGADGATSSQHLGLFNATNDGDSDNHVFGVEFDVFKNEEFEDIDDNHVGLDVNSLKSEVAHGAGYWPDDGESDDSFKRLQLNDGRTYQVWIDYEDSRINVTMAPAGLRRPRRPLLNATLNLSQVFEDEMYVGFTAATGQLVESHKVLAWSFSNSNFSLSEALITTNLPSFMLPEDPIYKSKGFIAGITLGILAVLVLGFVFSVLLVKRNRRRRREREEMEDWELEYWPHRITYQEIEAATKGFSEGNVIGVGGNGKVYKGVIAGGAEVAVKRISHQNSEGVREFLSEISSLGRLTHRNLVGLRGWCKKEKGTFILLYDYMENGSLDQRIFDCDENTMLNCEDRIRILKDMASALFYLHEGWEAKVLHRDIKASNVLLDKYMNARLGDFGLARMHEHGESAATTRVVGTIGYLAPELVRNGRASTQTDVFGFGVLVLEVLCGRRPIEEGKPPLVEWTWELMRRGELIKSALDERIRRTKGSDLDEEEVEKVLQLGLLCAHPDPNARPTMRQVVKFFERKPGFDEPEGGEEDMEAYLLAKIKIPDIWSSYSQSYGSHPTFEEIREGLSSISVSFSNSLVEGR